MSNVTAALINDSVQYWTFDKNFSSFQGLSNYTSSGNVTILEGGRFGNYSNYSGDVRLRFNESSFGSGNNMTINFWVNKKYGIDGITGDAGYVWMHNATGLESLEIYSRLGVLKMFLLNYSDGFSLVEYSDLEISDESWHMVTLRKNSTDWGLFYDTVLKNTTKTTSILNYKVDMILELGRVGSPYFLAGGMDELGIWNRTLTNSEINDLFLPPFIENSITYSTPVYETSNSTFILNFTTNNIVSASSTLNYNGTNYPSSVSCNSNECTSSNYISIPLIPTAQQNNSFFWTVIIYNGNATYSQNSTSKIQTVNQISLTSCTSGDVILNFTAKDEQNSTRISPFDFEGNFEYSVGSSTIYRTLNISNSSATEIQICLSKNTTYYINAIIAYSAPSLGSQYIVRNWFYQHYPINNVTTNVSLPLLVSASSTSFILQVQNSYLLPVPGVLVEAQRCYPGTNTIETVFKSRTDNNGLTVGNLEAETALYQFLITNQSNTLLAVTPCSKIIPQTTPYTLLFQLGTGYQSPFTDIDNVTDIVSNVYYNYTNNILSWTYTDTSGQFTNAQLVVKALNYSGNVQPTICSGSNNLSSGIITCNVSDAGSYFAQVYVYRASQTLIDQVTFTVSTFASTVGYYGAFLGFFIILISCFAFKFNEIAGIWLVIASVIFCNAVGLIAFGAVFVTAILCLGVVITSILER